MGREQVANETIALAKAYKEGSITQEAYFAALIEIMNKAQ